MQTFEELKINPALLRSIREMGYTQPSPIQAQALPVLLGPGSDFIGLAATGTGKTAAFTLPLLEKIDPNKKATQGIILCPTRELCLQVAGQVNLIGKHMNIRALPIYGGAGYDEQLYGLRRHPPVVVGTPGRVIDHLQRGTLKLDQVDVVILDEADEMISMGFKEAMETILKESNPGCLKWMFSATMSPAVRRVADQFLKNPKSVQVNRSEMLSSTVEQYYYATSEQNKPEVLCKLIDAAEDFYGIVFCQTKTLVSDLTHYLIDRGYKADCLHGDMSQNAREVAIQAFRDRRKQVMICTDVASRGLDVKDVTHVINYSLPRELDSYVHRIGRTARSGKNGVAMSLVTRSHFHLLQKIERLTKSRMNEGVIPTRRAIGMKKISQLLGKFTDQKDYARAMDLMDESWKNAISAMSSQEVAARFLTLLYPYVFADQPQERMDRTPQPKRDDTRPQGGGQSRNKYVKEERRDQKRKAKRDFSKKFKKGFQPQRPNRDEGGNHPPRRG